MNENIFRFKKFDIKQNSSVMKIGTDGVLLGSVINCNNAKRILDIGTGTGLIALMMAQKSNVDIDCIDINHNAINLAKLNIANSPWKDRINVFKTHLQNFNPSYKYDLIVSNPPYFNTNVLAPDKNRAIARHSIELSLEDLINNARRLLSSNGKFSFIYPYIFLNEIKYFAAKAEFFIKSEIAVFPQSTSHAKRIIIELSKSKIECTYSKIYIENNLRHDYTQQYIDLTKDYYLNF